MKIAIVHNHPIHYKHLLFQEMKMQGLDFEVLFLASGSSIRHERIPLSGNAYNYRIGHEGPYETAPFGFRACWTWSALQELKPDFLVISGYYAVECWVAWLWGRLNGAPRIMWFESNEFDYPRLWFREILKRIFLKGCRGAHVYGASNKAYLVKLGMPSENITVKRAVVDIPKFDTAPGEKTYRRDELTRLIYVGRLAPEKNLAVLLKALAIAVAAGARSLRLIVAGKGPDEAALKDLANGLGIAELVEFRGYTPQKDLATIYREADFFVLPSIREPWGLVALEAMLCRLPAIVSTQCGCAVDVVSPITGWSFSPWSEAELAGIFEDLPAIPTSTLRAMGDAAHQVAAQYSPKNSASLVAHSIRKVTSVPDPRSHGVAYSD
jgi:glycosyltransferase involved in cell wall biosynthesis